MSENARGESYTTTTSAPNTAPPSFLNTYIHTTTPTHHSFQGFGHIIFRSPWRWNEVRRMGSRCLHFRRLYHHFHVLMNSLASPSHVRCLATARHAMPRGEPATQLPQMQSAHVRRRLQRLQKMMEMLHYPRAMMKFHFQPWPTVQGECTAHHYHHPGSL